MFVISYEFVSFVVCLFNFLVFLERFRPDLGWLIYLQIYGSFSIETFSNGIISII